MATVQLNAREKQLKGLLLDVASYIDKSSSPGSEPLVLRWAGGWVRDKVLGIDSHDIDTAINSMTGYPFAERMRDFCADPTHVERHGIRPEDVGNLHRVAANPDKSKHLETATVKMFGIEVDFVNLRRETYSADSRNPQVEFGTAEEDARRRDATVNALFYNLHTGELEDFTGGLADMGRKLIRTPLEPLQTFTDDPLRVLRLVRFASRLGFTIDPAAEEAMGDRRVLEALNLKISRERVGVEMEKMLKGNHPCESLRLIDKLGLHHTVFTDPAKEDMPHPDTANWKAAYECLESLAGEKSPSSLYETLVRTDEAKYLAWVLAALVPWEGVHDPEPPTKGKPPPPLVTLAAREGIRAPNRTCDLVTAAHRYKREIVELKQAVCEQKDYIQERDRFGMAIRHWDDRGVDWRLQVLYAVLTEVMESPDSRDDILQGWQKFLQHLQELDVMEAPSTKRLIDGRQLATVLGIKPGKWMMGALEVCMAWQLRHPGETDMSGAVEEVRGKKEALGIAELLK